MATVNGVVKPTVAGVSASSTLGNGGADYNTAEAELKKKIAQNQLNISTNKNFAESETARALKVIQERQAAGQDTTAQQKYLTNNLGYKAPTATTNTTNSVAQPAAAKTNASQGSTLMEQMLAIANREKQEFSYDPNSDPAYQAALKRASANIDTGNSAAQAEMNRRGILNSTITSDRMSEIASAEMGNVETTVIPQLMAQAYQKYQDQQNQEQQQFANMGSLAQMYTGEDQRGIDNTNTTAGLTGYLPFSQEAQSAINSIIQLKQQAEAKGITAAERTKLSAQADGYRAQLISLGIDPAAYSSAVNSTSASKNSNIGIRTLAGQTLDANNQAQSFNQTMDTRKQNFTEGQQGWQNNFQTQQQGWENKFKTEQQAYQAARDAISDNRWKAEFDQSVSQFGLNYALNQLQESNSTAYQQAQLALSQDDNARQWAITDYDMSKSTDAAKYSGMTATQVIDSARQMFTVKDAKTGKESFPTDATSQDNIYNYVGSLGLPMGQDDQVMLSLGLTKATINALDKKYGVTSGN